MESSNLSIPPWPHFADDEIEAATHVMRSGKVNYWTGEECKAFEQEFADFIDVPYAISLANGTLALEVALRALNIGPGDDVIVPCRTFIATASSVVACGARPIVADIDLVSQNITVDTISEVMTPKTKAIIPVHLAGWPCAMDDIMDFAQEHNLKVIEDCAQAHGAKYKGQYVGSFGDAAAFSFCQDKIMTTGGEGGMLLTKDEKIWQRAWAYKDHGKNPHKAFNRDGPAGFRWLHESFGSNFRMTEMQAAIGREQLKKLPRWLEARKNNAKIFTKFFSNFPQLRLTLPSVDIEHAYYKYYVFIEPDKLKSDWNRDRILQEINATGVPCASGSCGEIYLEHAFIDLDLEPEKRFKNAQQLAQTSLMFLVHPTLNEQDIKTMCTSMEDILKDSAA